MLVGLSKCRNWSASPLVGCPTYKFEAIIPLEGSGKNQKERCETGFLGDLG